MEYNWDNKNVLVVEDEDSNYFLVEAYLRKGRANIIRCIDGKEAVNYCMKHDNLDLILMDINMPQLNGFEATTIIRGLKPYTPVVALTAYALAGDREKTLEAGCNDYMSKPIDQEAFMELVGRILG